MSEDEFFNPYKQFTGCWIPNWLLEREELSLGPKVAYARLAQFAGKNGVAVVRRPVLAKKLASAERSVGTYLTELEQAGLIHIKRRGQGKPNEYRFLRHAWMLDALELPDRQDLPIKDGRICRPDRQDLPLSPNEENQVRDAAPLAPRRPDVDSLCQKLAERIVANGGSAAKYHARATSKTWRESMRLLLDRDLAEHNGTAADRVAKAIDWCQSDDFWRSVVLSPAKLREQYDALRLAAQRQQTGNGHGRPKETSADHDDRVAKTMRDLEQVAPLAGASPEEWDAYYARFEVPA